MADVTDLTISMHKITTGLKMLINPITEAEDIVLYLAHINDISCI